jgi:DNA processing protein
MVISLLASGHDFISPQSNRDLVDKIAENGLVISEYPPETQSAPWRFPMRNRLIAALADGVLILSGAEDSGTRYTAKFAEAYSKRIYAIPYSLGEKSGEICNMLIKLGKAQLIENAEDVARGEGVELGSSELPDLDEDELIVLRAMDGETHIDEIALRVGKKSYEILSTLSMLEIKGIVAKGAKNSYTSLIKL